MANLTNTDSATLKKGNNLPDTPYGPKIASVTDAGIEFYWKKIENADGYEVFRSYDPDADFEKIGDVLTRNKGTYIDNQFDPKKKTIYYKSRSFLTQKDDSRIYSDFTKAAVATFRDELKLERDITYMYDGTSRSMGVFYGWGEVHDVRWSSSNENVAVMGEDGRIQAKATGEAVLKCYSKSLRKFAFTTVVVNRASMEPADTGARRFQFNPETMHWENGKQTNDAVIMMVGDLMCGAAQTRKQFIEKTGWRYDDSYTYVKRTTAQSDFAVGNLETLMAASWPYMIDESYIENTNNCNSPSRYLDAVLSGGFDAVTLSNNHNCDGGPRALKDTIAEVALRKIPHTGAFMDSTVPRFMIVNINGIKVGFLAYMSRQTGFNGKDATWSQEDAETLLNVFTPERAKQDIQNCKAAGAEYIIAYMHWGKKNYKAITKPQSQEAQGIADAGADYIVGANPHVLQVYDEITACDGRIVPCFYSTGNFQAYMDQIPGNRDSVMVRVRLKRNADGAVVLDENGYIPYHTYTKVNRSNWAPVAVGGGFDKDVPVDDRSEYRKRVRLAIGKKISIHNPNRNKAEKASKEPSTPDSDPESDSTPVLEAIPTPEPEPISNPTPTPEPAPESVPFSVETESPFRIVFPEDAWAKENTDTTYTIQYSIKQVCDILGIAFPENHELEGKRILTNITCNVNSLAFGGAFILIGMNAKDRESQLKRALTLHPRLIIAGKASEKLLKSYDVPYIIVPSAYNAMVTLSESIRNDLAMTVVGVTGSVGKTSTKEILASVLSQHYQVEKNPGNRNNTKGIFISLQSVAPETQVYVQEFGVAIGAQSMESKIAACRPNITVITNISDAHLDVFGCRENILKEKIKLATEMVPGGTVFLNYDDALLKNVTLEDKRIISYAVHNKDADYYAENIQIADGQVTFDIVHNGNRTSATLYSYGLHNVENAVAATAVGEWLGMPTEKIVAGIAAYKTDGIRQSLVNVGGYNLYLDCYNASPLTLKGAVATVASIPTKPGGKRIGVIGEMKALGEQANQLHEETGVEIAKSNLDLFICFGDEPIEHMVQKIREANKTVFYTNDRQTLNDYIRQHVTTNDVVLFKGSHATMLFKTVDQVFGTAFLEEDDYEIIISPPYRYKVCAENNVYDVAAIAQYFGQDVDLTLPSHYENAEIKYLSAKSFYNNPTLQTVSISATISNIGAQAFCSCTNLKTVTLPSSLKIIGAEAFCDCVALEEITIPESVIEIGDGAFKNCTNLKRVVLPAALGRMGDNVFDGCPEVVLVHSSDSL